tara:strand:- start:299 stop:631 length:333 start_codon:yes stop_codon:yes gene_type:complete
MSSKLKTYIGIIDAHGLESLSPKSEGNENFFYMRASLNRQRHSTYFEIDVEPLVAANIIDVCSNGDPISACKMVKDQDTLRVPTEWAESVSLLPNPRLDPWHSEDIEESA